MQQIELNDLGCGVWFALLTIGASVLASSVLVAISIDSLADKCAK